ncbi:hypothetical protein Peur_062737 [Populus x canadensis]
MALFSPIELYKKKANLPTISWSDDRNETPQQNWGLSLTFLERRGLLLWPQTARHAKKKMANLFLFFFFLRMEQAKEGVAFKEKEGQRRKLQLGHKDKSSTKNGHLLTLLSH